MGLVSKSLVAQLVVSSWCSQMKYPAFKSPTPPTPQKNIELEKNNNNNLMGLVLTWIRTKDAKSSQKIWSVLTVK